MKRALEEEKVAEEVPFKQPNPRLRPRFGPSPRQSLFFHYSTQTKDEERSWSPYNDPHKTLQFLLVSRAYFHVFFGAQLKISCERKDAVCTTAIYKFFASAVDRLLFRAGKMMAALLRLSSVRRLKFQPTYVKPSRARQMFEAIEKMSALEWLSVDVYRYDRWEHDGWLKDTFLTHPPFFVRFEGYCNDVRHLVGREHQCEEIVMELKGETVLYPLNARKVVVKGGYIEQFENYEGLLSLESTQILEFPFEMQRYECDAGQYSREFRLPQVVGGITRVVGQRKTPLLLLKTEFEAHGFVHIAGMLKEIERCERNIDALLSECEKRNVLLQGLRLELNIRLFEAATSDEEFMKKVWQAWEQKFGAHMPRKERERSTWFRVESEKRTELSMRISWDHYYEWANDDIYDHHFDDLEFDCGESREEFDKRRRNWGFASSSEQGDEDAVEDERDEQEEDA
ncbi:hypothetical protein M3Y99_00420700 [Aphelenchoides fujianensis]|nr:hypothetical protein M3Y99_00420700 [Aphelenchoides fujianensis]